MKQSMRVVVAGIAVAAAMVLPAGNAFARGTNAGGTGGGGGGGTTTGTCVPSATVKATAGYRPGGGNIGALWTDYTVSGCVGMNLAYDLVQTNTATNTVALAFMNVRMSSGVYSTSFDNDSVPLATTYRVDLVIHDVDSGAVVASALSSATTPKSKNGTTLG